MKAENRNQLRYIHMEQISKDEHQNRAGGDQNAFENDWCDDRSEIHPLVDDHRVKD